MLFNVIILVILAYYAVITPIIVFKSVKFGIKLSDKPQEAAEEPFFNVPKKKELPKMTPEEQRTVQILDNINRYDGTSHGQVKVK